MLQFAPDLDPATPGILLALTNAIPTVKGYTGSYIGVATTYPALAAAANSLVITKDTTGTSRFFAGTQTAIYEGSGGTWTDRSSGAYDIGVGTRWAFGQFGNKALAIAKTVALQSSSSGNFAAVAGAPKATNMATGAGFVMICDTNDATNGDQPDRWYCSAYQDETDWTPSVTTECATGRLVDTPGPLTGVASFGDGFVAFKPNSMYFGQYVGAPAVFDWQQIPGEVGVRNKDSICVVGNEIYFLGNDQFYVYQGSRPIPIGTPIREWFFKTEINPAYAFMTQAVWDRPNQSVWFFYCSTNSTNALDKAVVYHVPTQRWGSVTMSIEAAANYLSDPITYATIGSLYTTYADLPTGISYDSPFWTAQAEVLAVANTSHVVQTLSGNATTGSITTGAVGDPQQFSTVSRVLPRFTTPPTSATLQHQYDNDYGDNWTNGPTATLGSGRFDLQWSARWHREIISLTGPYELIDFKLILQPDGSE